MRTLEQINGLIDMFIEIAKLRREADVVKAQE